MTSPERNYFGYDQHSIQTEKDRLNISKNIAKNISSSFSHDSEMNSSESTTNKSWKACFFKTNRKHGIMMKELRLYTENNGLMKE